MKYYNPWFFAGSTLLCIATGLYTTFTAFTTTSGHWIGVQVLQGLGCGFAAQMPLLTVQDVLKEKPRYTPLGISTVLFAQYFGSAVIQSIGGSIFTNRLVSGLLSSVHLSPDQVNMLLDAGNSKVREVVSENFPHHLDDVIIAYNDAIISVFVRISCKGKMYLTLLTFLITVSCRRRERVGIFACGWNQMERQHQE